MKWNGYIESIDTKSEYIVMLWYLVTNNFSQIVPYLNSVNFEQIIDFLLVQRLRDINNIEE